MVPEWHCRRSVCRSIPFLIVASHSWNRRCLFKADWFSNLIVRLGETDCVVVCHMLCWRQIYAQRMNKYSSSVVWGKASFTRCLTAKHEASYCSVCCGELDVTWRWIRGMSQGFFWCLWWHELEYHMIFMLFRGQAAHQDCCGLVQRNNDLSSIVKCQYVQCCYFCPQV